MIYNRKSGIVVLLFVSLISFSSCITTDKTLASIYIPTNQDITIKSAEIDIPVELKISDSMQTATSAVLMMGAIASKEFGTVTIGSAATVTPSADSIEWGGDPVFIDMSMQVAVYSKQTMSSEQDYITQNVYAYPLTIELDSTDVYNNSIRESDYDHKPISLRNTLYMGGDSLNMHFTKEFGERFFAATREELDSNELFMKRFYGIYFKTDVPETGLIGGRIINLDLSTASIILSFTSTNYAGVRRDTSVSFTIGDYYYVNTVAVNSQKLETDDAKDAIYIEGLSGIKPVINAKKLKSAIEHWSNSAGVDLNNILIAKATMEFPYEYSGYYKDLDNYPKNLFPCLRTVDTTYTYYSPISEIYDSNFNNGAINRSQSYYRPDMGIYLQSLINKETSEVSSRDDLWMIPTLTYTSSTTNETYYFADYSTYYIAVLNGTKAARHPKLKITYTELK
ncbi:MAG: hypothetical protein PHD07_06060 [Bacteroidales bacterium]|nr:hypothetical protein [Bacteroidales bacterium]MDD3200856.1 hypothetical protein [Bacteroidales bacterium]